MPDHQRDGSERVRGRCDQPGWQERVRLGTQRRRDRRVRSQLRRFAQQRSTASPNRATRPTSTCTDGTARSGAGHPAGDRDQPGRPERLRRRTGRLRATAHHGIRSRPDGSLTPTGLHRGGVSTDDPMRSTQRPRDRGSVADALTVSPDGKNVYAADQGGEDIATFTRADDGSLSEPDGCISGRQHRKRRMRLGRTGMVRDDRRRRQSRRRRPSTRPAGTQQRRGRRDRASSRAVQTDR